MPTNSPQLREEYQQLFDSCFVNPAKAAGLASEIRRINAGRARYEIVSQATDIPWFLTGIIHNIECDCNFEKPLPDVMAIDQPLTGLAKYRPENGKRSSQWEDVAIEALRRLQPKNVLSWDLSEVLYRLESYNGFGYWVKGLPSPYLWNFSNHYKKGTFLADGSFDANAVSKRAGAAVLLHQMMEQQMVELSLAESLLKK